MTIENFSADRLLPRWHPLLQLLEPVEDDMQTCSCGCHALLDQNKLLPVGCDVEDRPFAVPEVLVVCLKQPTGPPRQGFGLMADIHNHHRPTPGSEIEKLTPIP